MSVAFPRGSLVLMCACLLGCGLQLPTAPPAPPPAKLLAKVPAGTALSARMALDQADIYWIHSNVRDMQPDGKAVSAEILSVPKQGGPIKTVYQSRTAIILWLVVSGDGLFWSEETGFFADEAQRQDPNHFGVMFLKKGARAPTSVARAHHVARLLKASDGTVYYSLDTSSNQELYRVGAGGGQPELVATVPAANGANFLAADARNVYWSNASGVYARPIKGSQDRPLLAAVPYCGQSDGQRLVVSDGRVRSVNVDGTGPIEHGEGDCPVVTLGNLYLAKQGRQVVAFGRSEEKGVLVKMTYVAEAKGTMEDFAADTTGIYYLDTQRNELMRQPTVPK